MPVRSSHQNDDLTNARRNQREKTESSISYLLLKALSARKGGFGGFEQPTKKEEKRENLTTEAAKGIIKKNKEGTKKVHCDLKAKERAKAQSVSQSHK